MSTNLPDLPVGMLPLGDREPRRVPPPPMSVRIPPDLLEHLRQCAEAECRSLNGEIVSRLLESAGGESIGEHGEIVRRAQHFNK